MDKAFEQQGILCLIILFVFNVAESYTTKHINFLEKPLDGSICHTPSLHDEQVFTTDVKNSTLAVFRGRVFFTPLLTNLGCATIMNNIKPNTHGYNTNSEEEDGLHKCYSFCTRIVDQFVYIGMHEQKCSCLNENDVDPPNRNKCTNTNIASCGFLRSTLCSTKENNVVLYAIERQKIHTPLECDNSSREPRSLLLGSQNALKGNTDIWSNETQGVKILKSQEGLHHKQHCCIAAYVANYSAIMNPMVSACNAKLPHACVASRKETDRLTYFVLLTLILCGLNTPVIVSLIYFCIAKRRNVSKNIDTIRGNGNTAKTFSTTQISDVRKTSTETMSVSPYMNGGDLANNALSFMLTEAFRRFNGDFRRCSIKISFSGNGEEEETYVNRRNQLSITFDNRNNRMRYGMPSSSIEERGADQRGYTTKHTYLNDFEFQGKSSNKEATFRHSRAMHVYGNDLIPDVVYENPIIVRNYSHSLLPEDKLQNHPTNFYDNEIEDDNYVDCLTPIPLDEWTVSQKDTIGCSYQSHRSFLVDITNVNK